ncbi:DUF6788 family protein [Leptolyngbya ohadii]|uniref:DUF6788 family protein n=1 Tax=Leptolyngbya ohadii TaxID=1962290 RepID=UPI000B598875|nr:DUF6788 family protein [Leptolyngbya ohadii]
MARQPDLNKLRTAFYRLNLEQAKQLYGELGAIVQELEQQSVSPSFSRAGSREVVETARLGDRLYQRELVRCGKVGCKCEGKNGELHGPYWYAYWRENGRLRSRYVGKRLRQI